MGIIDFILNLVALLLWFNWRTARFDPLAGSTPATLAGTLRRASAPTLKSWLLPLSIPLLLLLRALFYWQIGGALGWHYEALLGRIQTAGLAGQIRLLGRVTEADLPSWYAACTTFCYPSLYEGFGLPVLEAMACGAAVVTSNVTSLPEVVGEAGLMVEPTDTAALSAALQRMLDDAALRQHLSEQAMRQAATFTWRRVAEQTLRVYEAVRTRKG